MTDYRATFDEVAELYDEVRPGYPVAVLDALLELAHLPEGGRILEVGPGTGQLTRSLAERGFELLGLELGPNLAAVARRNLSNFPKATILTTAFEDWQTEENAFDLVVSAQAFHWIRVEYGLAKCAAVLKKTGSLALLWQLDRSQDTDFYKATTPLFDKYVRDDPDRPKPPSSFETYRTALVESPLFDTPVVRQLEWQRTYTKADFVKLLGTFSPNIALAPDTRARFNAEVAATIDAFGGSVTRLYRTVLLLSKKV